MGARTQAVGNAGYGVAGIERLIQSVGAADDQTIAHDPVARDRSHELTFGAGAAVGADELREAQGQRGIGGGILAAAESAQELRTGIADGSARFGRLQGIDGDIAAIAAGDDHPVAQSAAQLAHAAIVLVAGQGNTCDSIEGHVVLLSHLQIAVERDPAAGGAARLQARVDTAVVAFDQPSGCIHRQTARIGVRRAVVGGAAVGDRHPVAARRRAIPRNKRPLKSLAPRLLGKSPGWRSPPM